MKQGRIPAQCVESCSRQDTLSRSINARDGEIIYQNDISQPSCTSSPGKINYRTLAVNYCNHVANSPKLFIIPPDHKPRAKIVQETHKKLTEAYSKPKISLKSMQFHDRSGNRVKSQRREAAIALLQVMNYYQDDATGRVGRSLDNGAFRDMSVVKLAEKAGIAVRRAKRALRDIIRAGYIRVSRQFIRIDVTGEIKGLPSIRSFLPKFFIDLDMKGALWTKWFSQRGWAQERSDKKISKEQRKKFPAMLGLMKHTLATMGNKAKSSSNKMMGIVKGVPSEENEKTRTARIHHQQKLGRRAVELFKLDPSKSIGEYLILLRADNPFK